MSILNRDKLPQIKDIDIFKKFLKKMSIKYIEMFVDIKKLDNLQTSFIKEKVELIKNQIKFGKYKHKPIIVTNDGTIIDGHHRYQTFIELKIPHIKCIVVNSKPIKLIRILK